MTSLLFSATLEDYPLIQNMARFYMYELSRYCGHTPGWELPDNGLYCCFDLKHYFTDSERKAFLVKLGEEAAGFVMIRRDEEKCWHVGEFFILAKFQGMSIGRSVARSLWKQIPAPWLVSVLPENTRAALFWRRTIEEYTQGIYSEDVEEIDYDPQMPQRIIFRFAS